MAKPSSKKSRVFQLLAEVEKTQKARDEEIAATKAALAFKRSQVEANVARARAQFVASGLVNAEEFVIPEEE